MSTKDTPLTYVKYLWSGEFSGVADSSKKNGVKLSRSRRLTSGDVVRVGETDLRYDT